MANKLQVLPAMMEPEVDGNNRPFAETFHRINMALKLFAFSPTIPSGLRKRDQRRSRWAVLSLCYSVLVILFPTANVLRLIYSMATGKPGILFYIHLCVMVWLFRCALHSYNIMRLMASPSGQRSKLLAMVRQLDENITRSTLSNCQKDIDRHKRRAKIMFIIVSSVVVVSSICIGVALLIGNAAELIASALVHPFEGYSSLKIFYIAMNVYLNLAWVAPALLYDWVCDSLVLKLCLLDDQLCSLGEHISVRDHASEIRQMFLTMTRLVGKADAMFGPMIMFLYVSDIVLFSVNLYISLYVAKSFLEHFCALFWISGALMNLLVVSFDASRVVEKGKEVIEHLQQLSAEGADSQSSAELSLLLFHLTDGPIVMTIWSYIPLYKSIVVSVFISLITYFTLLLQFK